MITWLDLQLPWLKGNYVGLSSCLLMSFQKPICIRKTKVIVRDSIRFRNLLIWMIDCGEWKLQWKMFAYLFAWWKPKCHCLDNFHFRAQPTSRSQSVYAEHICCCRVQYQKKPWLHVVLAPWIETCPRFQVNLSISSDEGLTLESFFICWLWKCDPRSSTRLMPNFGVSFSHPRHTAVSFETNHRNTNNSNCLFTNPQESEKDIKEVNPI